MNRKNLLHSAFCEWDYQQIIIKTNIVEVLIKDVVVSMPRSKKDAYIETKVKKYIKLGRKSASWDDPILKQIQFTDTLSRTTMIDVSNAQNEGQNPKRNDEAPAPKASNVANVQNQNVENKNDKVKEVVATSSNSRNEEQNGKRTRDKAEVLVVGSINKSRKEDQNSRRKSDEHTCDRTIGIERKQKLSEEEKRIKRENILIQENTPSHFQRKIIAMDLETFRTRTNIADIVREEFKIYQPEHTLGEKRLQKYIVHYYQCRARVSEWQQCCLKNLVILKENKKSAETQSDEIIKTDAFTQTTPKRTNKETKDAKSQTTLPVNNGAGFFCQPKNLESGGRNAAVVLHSSLASLEMVRMSQINQNTQSQLFPSQALQDPLRGENTYSERVRQATTNLSNECQQSQVASQLPLQQSSSNAEDQATSTNVDKSIILDKTIKQEKINNHFRKELDNSSFNADDSVQFIGSMSDPTIIISDDEEMNTEQLYDIMDEPIQKTSRIARIVGRSKSLDTPNTSAGSTKPSSNVSVINQSADKCLVETSSENIENRLVENRSELTLLTEEPSSTIEDCFGEDNDENQPPTNERSNVFEVSLSSENIHIECIRINSNKRNIASEMAKNEKLQNAQNKSDKKQSGPVPAYTYRPLMVESRKREFGIRQGRISKTGNKLISESENKSSPVNRTNPKEYEIEADSSIEDNARSQPQSGTSSSHPMLSSQNSIFLNSQLLRLSHNNNPSELIKTTSITSTTTAPVPTTQVADIAMPSNSVQETTIESAATTDVVNNLPNGNLDREIELPRKKRKLSNGSPAQCTVHNDEPIMKDVTRKSNVCSLVHPTKRVEEANKMGGSCERKSKNELELLWKCPCARENGNTHQFLHYIDIKNVTYPFCQNPYVPVNNCHSFQDLKTVLNYQCKGLNNVTLNGKSTQMILKLSSKEWNAVQEILQVINQFSYESRNKEPSQNASIFHRTLFYLFKTTSVFSNLCLEHNENGFDNVNVVKSTHCLSRKRSAHLADAIDPYVLNRMREVR